MVCVRREIRIRRRMIRRLIRVQRDAMLLRLMPAVKSIHIAMVHTEAAEADRTPNLIR